MDTMENLERRIEGLRQLLSGEVNPAPVARKEVDVDHRPAHAAPGPLLDDFAPVPEVGDSEMTAHSPAHAAPGSLPAS